MVPVFSNATCNGKKITELLDLESLHSIIATVRGRGLKIIIARGKSSAASAAQAALDHIRDWYKGTSEIVSVSLPAPKNNIYGVEEGIIFSFPCISKD
jgi:malate dehydrogenase